MVLLDPYARINHEMNLPLAQGDSQFLSIQKGQVVPNPEYITIIQDLNKEYHLEKRDPVDLVFSSSVLEHVSQPQEIIHDLSRATHPEGNHIHFVDLRDHFFKHPFEMLCHSEVVWSRFLNPSSNLNRLRAWDFEEIFRQNFQVVELEIFEKELVKFRKAKPRIRPEYMSGNEDTDCAARVLIKASCPSSSS
jgi:SAM-dependent methyltransferase